MSSSITAMAGFKPASGPGSVPYAGSPRQALEALEVVIGRGLTANFEVGEALAEIRDRRLYRVAYTTFESYYRLRWGMERAHAYRLIDAAEVAALLSPTGDIPANEAQARELAVLKHDPERMAEAWKAACSDGKPTAAKVREAVGRRRDESTPQDLFDDVDAEFSFSLDVCTSDENAKCERYFTLEEDGLSQNWVGYGSVWMNCPYDNIAEWLAKAKASADAGATVVCLVPARTDTNWWWDYCRHGEICFLRGRLKFGGAERSAPFPSALVVFGPGVEPAVRWWDW